jgi:hypothetical protein
MEYAKPEVTLLAPALSAVQSHVGKASTGSLDSIPPQQATYSPPAYEADE